MALALCPTLLSFPLALACAGVPTKAPASQAPAKASAASEDASIFGEPLVVAGKRISDATIERFLCVGFGNKQVDNARFQVLIQQEIDHRRAKGEDVSKLSVTPQEVDKTLQKQREDFLLKYPTLDFPTEVARALISLDLYREQVEQAILFDKVFLPDNPEEWPDITREVLMGFGEGEGFLEDAKESYAARKQKQMDEKLDELPPDDPIIVDVYRQEVLSALGNSSDTKMDASEVPEGVLITVDGVPIRTEAIWPKIQPYVTPDLVLEAKRYLALTALVESDLAARGGTMSYEEFKKVFPKDGRSFEEELSNHQMLAIQVKGFPSLESYLTHLRLLEIHKRLIADELKDDQKLLPHLPVVTQIAGAAKADVEVILCSAYDFQHVRWKPNGWAQAEEKASKLKKDLDGGADWTQTIELYSDFWDPPMPETGPDKPQFGFKFKGKFGPQTRNTLLQYMSENDYRMFLYGPSVTDHIFFEQKLNSIEGPFKGPHGYYISRLSGRVPPTRPLDMADKNHRSFVEQYYVQETMNELGRKLLADAQSKGTLRGV